ncbi:triphosphoribosyl-dephospho-CoA synthase [Streptomyces sp. NPDC055681]
MGREEERLARTAVDALLAEVELTPEPGLPDARNADISALRWSARSLAPGLAAMAAAARRTGEPTRTLREELGSIGRCTERSMTVANGGTPLHHGAVWPLGLLVASAALVRGTDVKDITAVARQLAMFPDRRAPRRPTTGSAVATRYGAAGARGEARAGFPHVRRATDALGKARGAGLREPQARLDALLTVMSTLQDTGLLHAGGPHGLREVQNGARAVLDAGGTGTEAGWQALRDFDRHLRGRNLSPRGSAQLLAAALFVDFLT